MLYIYNSLVMYCMFDGCFLYSFRLIRYCFNCVFTIVNDDLCLTCLWFIGLFFFSSNFLLRVNYNKMQHYLSLFNIFHSDQALFILNVIGTGRFICNSLPVFNAIRWRLHFIRMNSNNSLIENIFLIFKTKII